MWYVMAKLQNSYDLSERLVRSITNWQTTVQQAEDVEDLIEMGADVNQVHGMLLPLHCACMVADVDTAQLLLDRGARVRRRRHILLLCTVVLVKTWTKKN